MLFATAAAFAATPKPVASYDGGRLRNGRAHGEGTVHFKDGDTYTGMLRNGRPHGSGVYTTAAGDTCICRWRHGYQQGQGVMLEADGCRYIGNWSKGKRQGDGVYIWDNGDRYVGEWQDDEMCGYGTLCMANGDRYVGTFEHGKKHGKGVYIWANGDRYEGDFRDGEITGVGVLYVDCGAYYLYGGSRMASCCSSSNREVRQACLSTIRVGCNVGYDHFDAFGCHTGADPLFGGHSSSAGRGARIGRVEYSGLNKGSRQIASSRQSWPAKNVARRLCSVRTV